MNHLAAIHASAKQLSQSEDDRRALMMQIVGKTSCKAMSPLELAKVRAHYDKLTARHSPAAKTLAAARSAQFAKTKAAASPLERKVWALWGQLGRSGKLDKPGPHGLQAFVQRTVDVSHIRFCTGEQLNKMIEVLKAWGGRA